ncbi:hypothetical protein Z052_15410 [Halorubrum sp. C191]|uniref:hypothetical protein n=1 Tax=Halorubrum sp. C191 TaxID=1383842 RepID=UPI000C06FD67|nr:hypothetical protein [Halorubrum sp. C191]PHQ41260.1 hypothetical protein Z052_15410 [Halorubrum sp. C191]
MHSDEELLEERLKWLKEAKRVQESRINHHQNPYLECFKNHYLPIQFQRLTDIDSSVLEEHIERLERDLQDAKEGEFKKK